MIPDNRPSSYGRQSYNSPGYNQQPRPPVVEDTLDRSEIQIEQKTFILVLKENSRGRFLRIVEQNGEHSGAIMIPETGLDDFFQALIEMVRADREFPPALDPRC
jgi:hypothetical protein